MCVHGVEYYDRGSIFASAAQFEKKILSKKMSNGFQQVYNRSQVKKKFEKHFFS